MIRPENYITDDLIWAFHEAKARPPSMGRAPLTGVSSQWLVGGCRLYRINRAIERGTEHAEAPQDCSAVGAWVEQRGK